MTRRLSGIHAAWHFWFAVSFGGESGLRKLGLCGIHPLTQRYNTESTSCSKRLVELLFVRYFVLIGVQYESYSFRSRYSAVI
ncbi:TPA: DUF3265 domain-containing protein [Vibrio vulnificus]|nr:DUF3265 domain-containing protein [Vibrio vulnificus]ELF6474327.1 DUF3265 domain-containing protein [Vibrio vulnificus]QET77669.1 DUF3265 domain-containing protein [Vibrio vulnificus]HAS6140286.1 DUF3265 domain-containing protein [Vibrio vulnificus]HAU8276706.1 DUF3265 domain-containing protein [Vibrio vulnificus]